MAKRKDSATETSETAAAADAPLALDSAKADGPAAESPAKPALEMTQLSLPKIDLTKLESLKLQAAKEAILPKPSAAAAAEMPDAPAPAFAHDALEDEPSRFSLGRYALAASVALAAVLGLAVGATATSFFSSSAPAQIADSTATDVRALRETVVRLSTELTAMQAKIETSNRNTVAQIGKLADRFERAEKASDPNAKLAKIADSLERLERRPAPTASEVTGSITTVAKNDSKAEAKSAALEGWRLREFFGGRALVESRGGEFYEVGPGSSIPGLGRVESIKRQDGKVVIQTAKGPIVGTPEPRRAPPPPPRYMYRY